MQSVIIYGKSTKILDEKLEEMFDDRMFSKEYSFNKGMILNVNVEKDKVAISIAQTRSAIDYVSIKTPKNEGKMVVIRNAHKMSLAAQNSLLKTLEEPPEYAIFVLLTTQIEMILNTVKSRCVEIKTGNQILTEENIKFSLIDILKDDIDGRLLWVLKNKNLFTKEKDLFIDEILPLWEKELRRKLIDNESDYDLIRLKDLQQLYERVNVYGGNLQLNVEAFLINAYSIK